MNDETIAAQRLTVSGLITRGGAVLMLRRALTETFLPGHYDLPGGKVDLGESPAAALARELREEAGLAAEVLGIYGTWDWISVYHGQSTHFVNLSFALRASAEAVVRPGSGFDHFAWVEPSRLDEVPMTPELRADVRRGLAWLDSSRGRVSVVGQG